MSFTHRIENDLLLVTAVGVVTQPERLAAIRTWLADPAYHPGMNTLFDLMEAESTPTMSELHELMEFIAHHAEAVGRKKLAMITSKPITYGVGRQFSALAAPLHIDVELFSSREAAMAWLYSTQP